MNAADLAALRIWADSHAAVGHVQARLVLELLAAHDDREAEVVRLQQLVNGLAARVAAQSEVIRRRAEK